MLPYKFIFNSRQEVHTFLTSLILYLLVLAPILRADRYYVDDWGRALLGYSKWADDGRPFADFLMRFLGGRPPLVDFSPLPQLFAIVVLSYLSVLISRKFGLRVPLIAALATLPLGANPFSLENLSFKFDSLPMAVSVSLAVLPFLYTRADTGRACIGTIVLLFASLCFYQASIDAFIVFLVLENVLLQLEIVPLRRLILGFSSRIFQLLAALVLYRLFAALAIHGTYGSQYSATSLTDIGMLGQNWIKIWSFVINSLWYGLRWPLIMPIGMSAILILLIGIRYVNSDCVLISKRARYVTSIAVLPAMLFLWLNASIFVLVILTHSPIGSCRTFIGMGALWASSLIILAIVLDRINLSHSWICLLLMIPGYTMTMFAFVYSNSLKEQKNYEMDIASRLSDDIYKVSANQRVKSISIEGNVGFSPFVSHNLGRFRLLGFLVPIDLRSDDSGGFARTVLKSYGIDVPPKLPSEQRQQLINQTINDSPIIRDRNYNIYRIDSDLLISLLSH